jgi:hypothetical protein
MENIPTRLRTASEQRNDAAVVCVSFGGFLLHRKDEVVASAALVVRFEGVAAAAEGRPIRQVSEGAADWVS